MGNQKISACRKRLDFHLNASTLGWKSCDERRDQLAVERKNINLQSIRRRTIQLKRERLAGGVGEKLSFQFRGKFVQAKWPKGKVQGVGGCAAIGIGYNHPIQTRTGGFQKPKARTI